MAEKIDRLDDMEGNLILSASQARQNEDWKLAEDLMQKDEVWRGFVADANRGGLIILFGNLRGFVPASHVADLPRGLAEDDRKTYLSRLVGQPIGDLLSRGTVRDRAGPELIRREVAARSGIGAGHSPIALRRIMKRIRQFPFGVSEGVPP